VRLLVEHFDEGTPDDLPFGLRVLDSRERPEEALLRVHPDDAHAQVLRESRHHLVAFAEAQQTVVDENTYELIAYGFVQQSGDHGGIDAA
jgi:hypothetical protein